MPTGYTSEIMERDGATFQKFALQCARAFGALVTMRDSDMSEPIPEALEPSPYYAKALAQARQEYSLLSEMTETAQLAYGAEKIKQEITEARDYIAKAEIENARLDAMVADVNKWNPPSPDHIEMKDFMLEQLHISRNNTEYTQDKVKTLEKVSPIESYKSALEQSLKNIIYYQKELASENDRTAKRNQWIKQLRESLAVSVDAHA